jgi:hypothetical protein
VSSTGHLAVTMVVAYLPVSSSRAERVGASVRGLGGGRGGVGRGVGGGAAFIGRGGRNRRGRAVVALANGWQVADVGAVEGVDVEVEDVRRKRGRGERSSGRKLWHGLARSLHGLGSRDICLLGLRYGLLRRGREGPGGGLLWA